MGLLNTSLGVASAATLVFTMITDHPRGRSPDAIMAAFAMVLVWGVTTVLGAVLSVPDSKAFNPVIDAMLAVGVGWAWWTHKEPWKLGLLITTALQSLAHVVYQTEYRAAGVLYNYTLTLNVLFIVGLGCIATPGAGYVADRIGGFLRDHRHPHPRPGAQP